MNTPLTHHRLDELEHRAEEMQKMSKDNNDRLIRVEGKLDHVSTRLDGITRGLWVLFGVTASSIVVALFKLILKV